VRSATEFQLSLSQGKSSSTLCGSFEESKRQDGETGKISSESESLKFLHLALVWVNVIGLILALLKRYIPSAAPDKQKRHALACISWRSARQAAQRNWHLDEPRSTCNRPDRRHDHIRNGPLSIDFSLDILSRLPSSDTAFFQLLKFCSET
jgi:hypothetical protein